MKDVVHFTNAADGKRAGAGWVTVGVEIVLHRGYRQKIARGSTLAVLRRIGEVRKPRSSIGLKDLYTEVPQRGVDHVVLHPCVDLGLIDGLQQKAVVGKASVIPFLLAIGEKEVCVTGPGDFVGHRHFVNRIQGYVRDIAGNRQRLDPVQELLAPGRHLSRKLRTDIVASPASCGHEVPVTDSTDGGKRRLGEIVQIGQTEGVAKLVRHHADRIDVDAVAVERGDNDIVADGDLAALRTS